MVVVLFKYKWGNKEVHAFLKTANLEVKIIAWLEFGLVYYNVAVQYISHDITPSLSNFVCLS